MLQIYNTETKGKKEFKPIIPGKISLYACGVTVYDYCHLGHARTFIAFDVIVRYLRYRGYEVTFIRNITDIDDKIINKAQQENVSINVITEKFITAMYKDIAALKLLKPDQEPRATEFIPQMINLVQNLINKDFAYLADNGDVYYNIRKNTNYGHLSKRALDDLREGARVEVNTFKRDPLDFVLWKAAKDKEPYWQSPWGKGRPGWHLECSAMAMNYFGDTLDLHGGGFDLIFPHHENECAQSEAATGKPFVNTWMHVGFLNINQEKMSKSLHNFHTIKDVLETIHPEVLRYALTNAHYRSHLEYSPEQLQLGKNSLETLYQALRGLELNTKPEDSEYEKRFINAMDDDFNIAEALAILFELAKEINKLKEQNAPAAKNLGALLKYLGNILGLLQYEPEEFFQNQYGHSVDITQINAKLAARETARKNKDWATADKIRKELDQLGVVIEDGASGSFWRWK